jgi:small GTP-binding protein
MQKSAPYPIIFFGIDQAGKTALTLTLKEGKTVNSTLPTLAFNIDKIDYGDLEIQIWDAPGQRRFRDIWGRGYQKAKILVFIIDTADYNRFEEAKHELDRVLNDEITKGIPLVFCFHKMDLPEAVANLEKAKSIFKLSEIRGRKVFRFETTIMDLKSLTKFKGTLHDIVYEVMW